MNCQDPKRGTPNFRKLLSQGLVLRVSIPFGLALGMFGGSAPGAPAGLQKGISF